MFERTELPAALQGGFCHSHLLQGFLAAVLLAFEVGLYFVVGAVLWTAGYLAVSLASTPYVPVALTPQPRQPKIFPDIVNCLLRATITPNWEPLVCSKQTKHLNDVRKSQHVEPGLCSGERGSRLLLGSITYLLNPIPDTFPTLHFSKWKMPTNNLYLIRSISSYGGSKCVLFVLKPLMPRTVCLACWWTRNLKGSPRKHTWSEPDTVCSQAWLLLFCRSCTGAGSWTQSCLGPGPGCFLLKMKTGSGSGPGAGTCLLRLSNQCSNQFPCLPSEQDGLRVSHYLALILC